MKYKTGNLPDYPTKNNPLPALTAGVLNQGLNNYVPETNATIFQNVISVSANGANTGVMFYQTHQFTVLQDAYVIDLIEKPQNIDVEYLYLVAALQKSIRFNFDWTNKAGWERIKTETVTLPTYSNGEIAFDYMTEYIKELEDERIKELEDERIKELEAYLLATGLKDYKLTAKERQSLESLDELGGGVEWREYKLNELFSVKRGTRLTVNSRIKGNRPLVTAGFENTGISGFISNDEQEIFSKNVITIDMFANVFYRGYEFSADDNILVLSSLIGKLSKNIQLYMSQIISKVTGERYSYGSQFRQGSFNKTEIKIPIQNGKINYDFMETYIRAMQKVVIKDVVDWTDKKIAASQTVINQSVE